MKNDWLANKGFWRDTVLIAVTVAGLLTLKSAATAMYNIPGGRFPAMMIEVMGSRAVFSNPGVTGYYERLFAEQAARGDNNSIEDHSFRLARLKPNLDWGRNGVTTNSIGLVGPVRTQHKPPNTRRVALLGDSIAMGLHVDPSHTFATLLERRLNAAHPEGASQRFEILNFAETGYVLTQMLDVAVEDAPRFEPDAYMLSLTELAVFRNWDRHLVPLIQSGIDLKYDFLRETVRRAEASEKDDYATLHAKLAPFRIAVVRRILSEMKSNAEQRHAQFLVVLVPSMEDGDLSRKRFDGIRELLASLDITFVDLLDTFDGVRDLESLRAMPGNVHPNARGHAMICDNLYAKVQAQPDAWSALVGAGVESRQ